MKEGIIYIHGKGGSIEEAQHYQELFQNQKVIGFDYQSNTPWCAKDNLHSRKMENIGFILHAKCLS